MTWLLIPILAVFVLYLATTATRVELLSCENVFAYLQLLMAAGSLPMLDPARDADRVYGYVLAYTLMAYLVVVGAMVAHQPARLRRVEVTTFVPGLHTAILVAVSVAVVVAYFAAVGYVALFSGLGNLFGSGHEDVTTLRLNSYSGPEYLFPGYVNQFKNVLLPALVVLYLVRWRRSGRMPLIAFPLIAISIIGLLGTGQRGAFVQFVATLIVFTYLLNARSFPRRSVVVAVVAIPIVLTATLSLGRSSADLSPDDGLGRKATVGAAEFRDRLTQDNQLSAVAGFRYIYESTDVQDGREWATSLGGLLPGQRGSDLANRIFAQLYGSDRGTSPESIWGSIYHNFGMSGIVVAPVLLAMAANAIGRRIRRSSRRSTLTTMGMAGTATTFGLWVASSPVFLLNAGIVPYVLMWVVGAGIDRRQGVEPERLSHTGAHR